MEDTVLKDYEVSFLVGSDADAEVVMKHLSAHKAKVSSTGPINQVNLAYPIKKHDKAYFGYVRVSMPAAEVPKLTDAMRLDNKIIRSLVIMAVAKSEKQESAPRARKSAPKEVSNEALEAKLAALQGETK